MHAPTPLGDTDAVDAYLARQPEPQQTTLRALRATLRSILPAASEGLSYGMPAFLVEGGAVAGYAAAKGHCGYFPMSGSVMDTAGDLVAAYRTSKGGLQFPVDRPLPKTLVRQLVKLRLAELAEVTDGRRFVHHASGSLKASGRMVAGEMHGPWRWYRADGTLMRVGRFDHGTESGTWETYDRTGERVSSETR